MASEHLCIGSKKLDIVKIKANNRKVLFPSYRFLMNLLRLFHINS